LTLLEREGLDPTSKRVLSVMEEAARRIDEISAALVNHAQPGENQERRPVDLREGLEATLRLLEHRSRDLAVHRDYAASRRVVGAAGPLNQVFLNLLDNAIRSAASNVWIRTVEGAGHVTVAVEDDGPGVSHQLVGRLFDPFFTTREPGEGTGLGLYLSSRIVHNHGGFLRYDPRPGGGASFSVDLPWEAPP
jgi:signal transduction histidine kinase